MKPNLVILTIILFSLSGCANSFGNLISGSRTNNDVVPDVNYGGKGIKIIWLEQMPPDVINRREMESTEFQIGVQLANEGYSDVTDGDLKVWSCKSTSLADTPYTSKFTLDRKDIQNLAGGMDQFISKGNANDYDEECYVRAQVCYPYVTHLAETLCVDPFPYMSNIGKPCSFKSPVSPKSQGAPVVVDRIDYFIKTETDATATFQFNIYPANIGKGKIIDASSWSQACSSSAGNDILAQLDNVYINARLGTQPMACQENMIKVNSESDLKKRKYFACTIMVEKSRGTYATILVAELTYGYIDGSEKNVKITGNKTKIVTQTGPCDVSHCITSGTGVCDLYGGLNPTQYCVDKSKLCCKKTRPDCEELSLGTCRSGCSGTEMYIEGKCPSPMKCCK